jgi:NAD(P)-dependent dehydrogenase (short-subunit alcohol dehydrogenase family)
MSTRRRRVILLAVLAAAVALALAVREGRRKSSEALRALFDGKVVVITGSSHGLGYALAERLAQLGAKLVLADIDIGPSVELAQHVVEQGGAAVAVEVDLADADQRQRVLDTARERFGTADVLFNNAGYLYTSRVANASLSAAHHMYEVNFWAYVDLAVRASRMMKERGSGLIVNISSDVASDDRGWENDGWTGIGFYVASKAAINALFKAMAAEMKGTGVNVKIASPGGIRTQAREHSRGPDREEFLERVDPLWDKFTPAADVAEKILINLQNDDVVIAADRLS